jgi:hypothetical protein
MKVFGLFLLIVFLTCTNRSDVAPLNYDVYLDLIVHDSKGVDLLNPNLLVSYKEENIRLFYLKDGRKYEFLKPNLEAPRNITLMRNQTNGLYYLRVFPFLGSLRNGEITTTFISWDGMDEDTVSCTLLRRDFTFLSIQDVKYNGRLKFDLSNMSYPTWGNAMSVRLLEIEK